MSKALKDTVFIEVTMVVAIDTSNGENTEWLCAMDYVEMSQGAQIVGFSEEKLEMIALEPKEDK